MYVCVYACWCRALRVGIAAPILLCAVRLFQGVSVGGELIGSIVYTSETAPRNRVGLYAGLSLMTAVLGTTMGMGVGAVMHVSGKHDTRQLHAAVQPRAYLVCVVYI